MQFPGRGPQPPVAVFDSAFDRIEDFLAMALLQGLEGKSEIRFSAVSVSRPDMATAQFVDVVKRFYSGVPVGSGFAAAFPVGLAAGKVATPKPIAELLAKKADDGNPVYKPALKEYSETGDPATVLRNALSAAEPKGAIVVVSGPLTTVAQLLALRGGKEMIALNVKHLAVAGDGRMLADAKAAQLVFAEWPAPIFVCGEDVGKAALFPGASIEKDFGFAKAHPIADAYRAFGQMPYDAPSTSMDAALYAVRPGSGFFKAVPGAGKQQRLTLDSEKTAALVTALTELASAKPVVRGRRGPPAAVNANAPGAGKKK